MVAEELVGSSEIACSFRTEPLMFPGRLNVENKGKSQGRCQDVGPKQLERRNCHQLNVN